MKAFFIFFLLSWTSLNAQEIAPVDPNIMPPDTTKSKKRIIDTQPKEHSTCDPDCMIAVVEAKYEGGWKAMYQYFNDNLRYPEDAAEMAIQGKVYISFIVEKDGSISCVKIERGVHLSIDKEAKRLVLSMPNWIPGECEGGEPARTKMMLPITFSIQ